MEAMLNNIFSTLGSYLSNYILIVALLGGGIWFTVKLGFIQVKGFGEGMRRTFGGMFKKSGDKAGADGMSSFQALATAIAAQVGTGNIAGAATALAIGRSGSDLLDVGLRGTGHDDRLCGDQLRDRLPIPRCQRTVDLRSYGIS